MIRIPTDRSPTHPGEMLLEEFLAPMGISQRDLADAIHVPYQRINEIINGRRGITPGTALRLAKFFGMSPDFWMNLQLRWDLYHAQLAERDTLKTICHYIPTSDSKVKHKAQRGHAGVARGTL
jgi:antitoxin HigA-1